jgi:opacity protein-like surface antigen
MRVAKWFLVAVLVLVSVPSWAQEEERKVNLNLGGGYTVTLGADAKKAIANGYNFGAGLRLNLLPKVGVQVEYAVHKLGEQTVSIPVALVPSGAGTAKSFLADAKVKVVSVNAVLRPLAGSGAKGSPYIIAGGGIYWRPVEVSTPAVGYVNGYCNPWWYECYPSGWVAVENLVGLRTSRDYGFNVGAGIDLKFGRKAMLYLEARYHYVFGPEILAGDGTSHGKATGQFLPFTIGLRF